MARNSSPRTAVALDRRRWPKYRAMADLLVKNATFPTAAPTSTCCRSAAASSTCRRDQRRGGQDRRRRGQLSRCRSSTRTSTWTPTLSYGLPREPERHAARGIALWASFKPLLTQEAIVPSARCVIATGPWRRDFAIRSHRRRAIRASLAVEAAARQGKGEAVPTRPWRVPAGRQWRSPARSIEPEKKRRDGRGRRRRHPALRAHDDDGAERAPLCEIAAEQGRLVDMHLRRDRRSQFAPSRRWRARRIAWASGTVNGSHLTSMHSMDNYYVSKLIR